MKLWTFYQRWHEACSSRAMPTFAISKVMLYRKRSSGLTEHEVAGEALLLDIDSGQIHQLNATATYIWRKCDQVESREELAGEFVGRFSVDYGEALRAVSETLNRLQQLNLIIPAFN